MKEIENPKTLLLFVHGFLGSESSFSNFPLDLVQSIRTQYKIPNIEARVFPFFATKGDPNKAINLLYNWLLLNATQPEYEGVIIMAHSMGGLIAADAYRKILAFQKDDVFVPDHSKEFEVASADIYFSQDEYPRQPTEQEKTKEVDSKEGTLSSPNTTGQDVKNKENEESSSWFGSWFSSKKPVEENKTIASEVLHNVELRKSGSSEHIHHLDVADEQLPSYDLKGEKQLVKRQGKIEANSVNIVAIIAYDSPFYGLASNVFTIAAGHTAADIIASYVPESHSSTVSSSLKYGQSLATNAIITSANAVSAIPSVASSAVASTATVATALPSTIYSNLPTASEAVSATGRTVAGVAYAVPSYAAGAVTGSISQSLYLASSGASLVYNAPSAIASLWTSKEQKVETSTDENPLTAEQVEKTVPVAVDGLVAADGVPDIADLGINDDKEEMKSVLSNDSANVADEEDVGLVDDALDEIKPMELLPIEEGSSWSPWMTLGVTTAVVVGGAYYSSGLLALGTMTLVRRVAVAYAVSHANDVKEHVQFLYPLWGESQADTDARMKELLNHVDKGDLTFKCYYVQLKVDKEKADPNFPDDRTFIKPPPENAQHVFHIVGTDYENEIAGHMNMFSRPNNPGHYWNLIHQTGKDIRDTIFRLRD